MSKELYTSPSDLKREQRRAAIEEKRKKLAQVKEKNLSIQSKALSTPSPSKKLDYGKTWDDIIETIESLPSTPQPSMYGIELTVSFVTNIILKFITSTKFYRT